MKALLVNNNVESEENIFGPGFFKAKEYQFYRVELSDYSITEPESEGQRFYFTLMLSSDKLNHIRKVYGLLDLLGDCGGLLDALLWIGKFVILIHTAINGSRHDEYLISKILKQESSTDKN